jgi:hypothetical protein
MICGCSSGIGPLLYLAGSLLQTGAESSRVSIVLYNSSRSKEHSFLEGNIDKKNKTKDQMNHIVSIKVYGSWLRMHVSNQENCASPKLDVHRI